MMSIGKSATIVGTIPSKFAVMGVRTVNIRTPGARLAFQSTGLMSENHELARTQTSTVLMATVFLIVAGAFKVKVVAKVSVLSRFSIETLFRCRVKLSKLQVDTLVV